MSRDRLCHPSLRALTIKTNESSVSNKYKYLVENSSVRPNIPYCIVGALPSFLNITNKISALQRERERERKEEHSDYEESSLKTIGFWISRKDLSDMSSRKGTFLGQFA